MESQRVPVMVDRVVVLELDSRRDRVNIAAQDAARKLQRCENGFPAMRIHRIVHRIVVVSWHNRAGPDPRESVRTLGDVLKVEGLKQLLGRQAESLQAAGRKANRANYILRFRNWAEWLARFFLLRTNGGLGRTIPLPPREAVQTVCVVSRVR